MSDALYSFDFSASTAAFFLYAAAAAAEPAEMEAPQPFSLAPHFDGAFSLGASG